MPGHLWLLLTIPWTSGLWKVVQLLDFASSLEMGQVNPPPHHIDKPFEDRFGSSTV